MGGLCWLHLVRNLQTAENTLAFLHLRIVKIYQNFYVKNINSRKSCVKFYTSAVYKSSNLLFPLPSKLLKSLIQPIVLIPRKILKDVQTAPRWDLYKSHLDAPLSTRIQSREKINIFGNILQTLWHSRKGSFVRKLSWDDTDITHLFHRSLLLSRHSQYQPPPSRDWYELK